MTKNKSTPAAVTTFDLRDLKVLLLRRRWWIIVPTVLGLLTGLAVSLTATPTFPAVAQVLIDPRGLQILEGSLSPANGQVTEASLVVVESQTGVILSQGNLSKVVAEQKLTQDPEFTGRRSPFAFIADTVRDLLGIAGKPGDPPELAAFRELQKKTTVKRGEKSYVVDITVETEDRFKSARLANAVADAFLQGEQQTRIEASQRASQGLGARLDELRDRLRAAEDKAESYKAQKNLVGAGGRLVSDQQLSDLNTQLGVAQTKASEARSRFEQVRRMIQDGVEPDAIAESLQSSVIAQLRGQYAEVRRKQAEVTAHLGSRHPDIVLMDSQIRSQKQLINQELSRIARSAQLDFERARTEAASLATALDKLKSQASGTSRELVRLRELEREVDTSRKIYEAFSKRARELGEQQAIDNSTTRKISEAVVPGKAKGLGMLALVLGGTIAGLAIGAGSSVLRDQLSKTIQSRRQVDGGVDLPILASLSGLGGRRNRAKGSTFAHRFGAPPLNGVATMALHGLDRRILSKRGTGPLTIMVTAPMADAGLSVATLCWAQAAAQEGRRVLVIDGHAASGRAGSRPVVSAERGLTDILRSGIPLDEVLRHDPELSLSWLEHGAGPATALPSVSVLQQAVLAQAETYDLVLVDVGNPESDQSIISWGEAADGIVVAVDEGRTDLNDLTASVEALRTFGQKVSGVIYVSRA